MCGLENEFVIQTKVGHFFKKTTLISLLVKRVDCFYRSLKLCPVSLITGKWVMKLAINLIVMFVLEGVGLV